jgi:hypothetical protein
MGNANALDKIPCPGKSQTGSCNFEMPIIRGLFLRIALFSIFNNYGAPIASGHVISITIMFVVLFGF